MANLDTCTLCSRRRMTHSYLNLERLLIERMADLTLVPHRPRLLKSIESEIACETVEVGADHIMILLLREIPVLLYVASEVAYRRLFFTLCFQPSTESYFYHARSLARA